SPRCATVSWTTRPPRRTERTRRQYVCAFRPFRRTACRRYIPRLPPAARSLARRPAPQQGAAVGTTSRFGDSATKSRDATEPAGANYFFARRTAEVRLAAAATERVQEPRQHAP